MTNGEISAIIAGYLSIGLVLSGYAAAENLHRCKKDKCTFTAGYTILLMASVTLLWPALPLVLLGCIIFDWSHKDEAESVGSKKGSSTREDH